VFSLSPEEWTAVGVSLKVALVATAVSLPIGIFTAFALARWRFFGKTLLDGVVHLPLVLPPVVTGYVLLISFGATHRSGRSWQTISALCSRFAGPARRWRAG
jgi:molybdate transport system permease protein